MLKSIYLSIEEPISHFHGIENPSFNFSELNFRQLNIITANNSNDNKFIIGMLYNYRYNSHKLDLEKVEHSFILSNLNKNNGCYPCEYELSKFEKPSICYRKTFREFFLKGKDINCLTYPENNLSGHEQSNIGNELAEMVESSERQIFMQTNSDHIINAIRVSIKEGVISHRKVKIFHNDTLTKITEIHIDKNGTLSEYPDGLLDEWGNQLTKLI